MHLDITGNRLHLAPWAWKPSLLSPMPHKTFIHHPIQYSESNPTICMLNKGVQIVIIDHPYWDRKAYKIKITSCGGRCLSMEEWSCIFAGLLGFSTSYRLTVVTYQSPTEYQGGWPISGNIHSLWLWLSWNIDLRLPPLWPRNFFAVQRCATLTGNWAVIQHWIQIN